MNINEIFAYNLKKYRKSKNLSQEELGYMCNLHRTYISSLEVCKKSPSFKTIEIIAKILDIKISDLFKEYKNE